MGTWGIVVNSVVIVLVGFGACAGTALPVMMANDGCGGEDHGCLLCTGTLAGLTPQPVGLGVLLLGYLGGLGVAFGLLAAGDGPHFGTGWVVIGASCGAALALMTVSALIPRPPIRRLSDLRVDPPREP